jgi:hypothetical protein
LGTTGSCVTSKNKIPQPKLLFLKWMFWSPGWPNEICEKIMQHLFHKLIHNFHPKK